MEPRNKPAEREGITYTGRGDLLRAAEALEAASVRIGLNCRRKPGDGGILRIEAEQKRSWHQVVLRALPQRVSWRLEPQGQRLSISAEFRLFRWYSRLLVGLFLLVIISLAVVLLTSETSWRPEYRWLDQALTALSFPIGLLAFAMVRLFGPLGGGGVVDALWQAVLAPLDRTGPGFRPQGITHTRRYQRAVLGYFWCLVSLSASIYLVNPELIRRFVPNGSLAVTAALILVALCIFAALFWNPTSRTFQLRSDPALPGLLSMLAMVVLLVMPLALQALAAEVVSGGPRYFLEPPENYLLGVPGQTSEELHDSYRSFFDSLRLLGWLVLGFTSLLAGVSTSLAVSAITTTVQTRLALQRLQIRREEGVFRRAIGDRLRVRRFRATFLIVWLLLSLLSLTALGYVLLCAFHAIVPVFSHPAYRLSELTAGALTYAFERPFGEPWIRWVARGAWVLYGVTVLALLLVSAGQLALARRAERRALHAARPATPNRRQRALRAIFEDLSSRAGISEVRLAVLPELRPYVAAQCFGFRGREGFVVVSEGALQDFEDAELEALLGHELVHLRQGHCRTMVFWRWLGRLTFAGDGFVLALQNSFGYEQEADRILLEEAWASAGALERCLIKMHHSAPGWQGWRAAHSGQRMPPRRVRRDERRVLAGELLDLPLRRRWYLAWWLFRQQYFAALKLHYWHPSYRERLEVVRASVVATERFTNMSLP